MTNKIICNVPYEEKLIGHIIKFYWSYSPDNAEIIALLSSFRKLKNGKYLYSGFDLKSNTMEEDIHYFSIVEINFLLDGKTLCVNKNIDFKMCLITV